MTPLEKALNEPRGNYLTQADWMAGCIRAFLEAAAEDDATTEIIGKDIAANIVEQSPSEFRIDHDGWGAVGAAEDWGNTFTRTGLVAKAAILALKETING